MTNMTQSSTITNIKKFFAQHGISNRGNFIFFNYLGKCFNMVSFKSIFAVAKNTLELVTVQNFSLPFSVSSSSSYLFIKRTKSVLPAKSFFVKFSVIYLPLSIANFRTIFPFSVSDSIRRCPKNFLTNKTVFLYGSFFVMKFNSIFRNTTQRTKFPIFLFSSIGKNLMTEFTFTLRPFFRRMVDTITRERAKFILFFSCQFCSELFFTNKTTFKNWIIIPRNRIILEITRFTAIFTKVFRWINQKYFFTIQASLFYLFPITREKTLLRTVFTSTFFYFCGVSNKFLFTVKTFFIYHSIGIIPSYSYLVKEEQL